jgi:molybdopterin synthase sulfur carrier subunit
MTESAASVSVRVLFFARARELTGVSSHALSLPPNTSAHAALRDSILPAFPSLAPLAPTCALAVNLEYVTADADALLKNGDELAVIPPISGG